MSFAAPLAFALAALAAAVIVLYILKIRRRRVVVPYLRLWEALVAETRAVTLFKRLKRLLSLLLQLAILAALILAVARPSFGTGAGREKSIVLVLDTSASLGAREAGGKRRFDLLLEEARRLVDARDTDDEWMIAAASDRIDVLTSFTKSTIRLRAALERVSLTNRSLDVGRAHAFAREVTRGKRTPLQVYLSDGNAGLLTKELAKDADAKIETIGESRENVGIVRFSARKNSSLGTDYVLATVKNYGDLTRSFTMEFVVNGLTQKVIPKTLAAGVEESESFQTRLPEGGSLQLKLGFDVKSAETAPSSGATSGAEAVADGLELDNSAYAVAYPDRLRRVVLVTATPEEAAPFKIAFRAMREVVDESSRAVTLEDYEKLAPEERQADVTICHGVVPTVFPVRGNLILIHTPLPSFVPATLAGEEASPTILDWDREHVLNRYLNYREMRIPPAHIVKLNAGVKIVDGGEGALVAAFDLEDRRVLYVAFDMTSQLFPFRLAFPMLLRNTVAWFETEEDLLFEETYAPGSTISPLRRVSIDKALARFVKGGREESVEIPVDRGRFRYEDTETPGPIVFRLGEREFGTAVNLFDGSESMIGVDRNAPRNVLGGSRGFRFGSGEWWTYFALAGLALWALEWALYHRRVTE